MLNDPTLTPAVKFLANKDISFRLFQHTSPVNSLEQAAQERGQNFDQVIRSIVFRISTDEFLMVLVPGKHQVSWRSLRKYLKQSRLTMASEEEVLTVTGYQLGAVTPFGLPTPMRVLLDTSILKQKEISIGSGKRGLAIIMAVEDVLSALEGWESGDFALE
jgi:Cys-tRNA(Pro)/Cys-tRNA(Cys) deacylase